MKESGACVAAGCMNQEGLPATISLVTSSSLSGGGVGRDGSCYLSKSAVAAVWSGSCHACMAARLSIKVPNLARSRARRY